MPPLDSRGRCAVCGKKPTSSHELWCAGVTASLRREFYRDVPLEGVKG